MIGFCYAVASAGDHMQAICTSFQTDNYTNASSLNFVQVGILSDAVLGGLVDQNSEIYFPSSLNP